MNPTSDFIAIDSQARSAFQLAEGASWECERDSPSEKTTTWSRDDEGGLTTDSRKFEAVGEGEFTRRRNQIQFTKRNAVVLFSVSQLILFAIGIPTN